MKLIVHVLLYVLFQTQLVPLEKELPSLRYQFSKLTDSQEFINQNCHLHNIIKRFSSNIKLQNLPVDILLHLSFQIQPIPLKNTFSNSSYTCFNPTTQKSPYAEKCSNFIINKVYNNSGTHVQTIRINAYKVRIYHHINRLDIHQIWNSILTNKNERNSIISQGRKND
jgi:hypothetical protein